MAVSPAEEILRTLTYNYTATTGSANYSQTTGIIVGPSDKGFLNNKITSSFNINCNSYKKSNTTEINIDNLDNDNDYKKRYTEAISVLGKPTSFVRQNTGNYAFTSDYSGGKESSAITVAFNTKHVSR